MELQEDCGCGARHEGKMAKHTAIECAQDAASCRMTFEMMQPTVN